MPVAMTLAPQHSSQPLLLVLEVYVVLWGLSLFGGNGGDDARARDMEW